MYSYIPIWSFGYVSMIGFWIYYEGITCNKNNLIISSDVLRPYVVDRKTLDIVKPIGYRYQWLTSLDFLPRFLQGVYHVNNTTNGTQYDNQEDTIYSVMYNNSFFDTRTLLAKYKNDKLMRYNLVHKNKNIKIENVIHEVQVTKNHVLIFETPGLSYAKIFLPWVTNDKQIDYTKIWIIKKSDLIDVNKDVNAKLIEIDKPTVHGFVEYSR